MSAPPRVFLVAGEASGDRLGAALMAGLNELAPGCDFDGVGGPAMRGQGLISRFPMDDLSVMGIAEVLPRYPLLRRRLHETAAAVAATRPDALVTIDSPDFGLRVAARVATAAPEVRRVHYVAPSVWAWRPGRARRMARHIEQVLALLPFEPPLMRAAGMRCDFVGHPAATEPVATDAEVAAFRAAQGIGDAPVILALPGSRQNEIARLIPILGDALRRALPRGGRVAVVAAPGLGEALRVAVASWPGEPVVVDADAENGRSKRAAFRSARAALAASGTVSLELAAAGTPMVIAYDLHWLSWQIMRRAALVDTVTLVNLVSETRAVPEFLGPNCRPEPIGAALSRILRDETARAAQAQAMEATMARLGRGGEAPGLRAARAVLDGLGRQPAR